MEPPARIMSAQPVAEVEVAVGVEPADVAERLPAAGQGAGLGADVAVGRRARLAERSHTSPSSPAATALARRASQIITEPGAGRPDRAAVLEPLGPVMMVAAWASVPA